MTETAGQRRVIGVIWFIASLVGLAVAFVLQPVADWGFFGTVIGVLVAILGLVGLWMAVTGKGRLFNSRLSVSTQKAIAIVMVILVTLIIIVNVVSDWANWTALDVLTISVWVSLGAMYVMSLSIVSRATPE